MKDTLVASQIPRGFRFSATACGLKRAGQLDLGLIASDTPAAAAAVFTTNCVQAAPVQLSRGHLRRATSRMRAIAVNAGNANCSTGAEGLAAAQSTAAAVARLLECRPEEILVCSTGVIGVPLPVHRILAALPRLVQSQASGVHKFKRLSRAIMTTDTRPKWAAATYTVGKRTVRVLGCAKGAGMIAPNMATMLGFIVTDAIIAPPLLQRALREAVVASFNRITVDGETSTNDTVAVLANGASGARPINAVDGHYQKFLSALTRVCQRLALSIVADGEGAQRLIEIEVCGAPSVHAAEQIARAIAHSPLVKTACAGADPNWGRIMAAAGHSGVHFNPARAKITLAGIEVFNGKSLPFDECSAHRKLSAPGISIIMDLRSGKQRATLWTCDFTAKYVDINASYRS